MYEKLQSHPSVEVSKKARQFSFSFKAMEMMKVKGSSFSRTTGYESYFEAFLDNESNYTPSKEEQDEFGAIEQAFPYLLLLVSPIFVVLFVALKKSTSL
ncbi:hypothetical protein AXF42_Ash021539 [Apostasia shenzhenica]|uniref:Uncharacterized protein n=1 Tax=Apostasia shenzhenica TaxID=1088818 RepID=A0A2H9ZSU0_9ASPA|nr:hypothetical protein AXF42_Ash021539 [Apostasia shenzhenica]